MGRSDYKNIKRVFLPIGKISKKGMVMFYIPKQDRRTIYNFKVIDI